MRTRSPLPRPGAAARALEYAERAKSRALLDLLAYRLDLGIRVRAEADRPLVEELRHLRSKRDRLYRRWEGQHEASSGVEPWEGERSRSTPGGPGPGEADHRAVAPAADPQRRLCARRFAVAGAHRAVQPYLSPETLLIEYFVVRGQLVAFLVTAEEVQARRLSVASGRVQRLLQLLWLNLRVGPAQ